MNPLSLILVAVSWTLLEFRTLAANVIFLGLLNDIVCEGLRGRFFGPFRTMGLIDGIMFNYGILAEAEGLYKAIFIGIFYGVGFLMMCFRVKEGDHPQPPKSDSPQPVNFAFAARTHLCECSSNP